MIKKIILFITIFIIVIIFKFCIIAQEDYQSQWPEAKFTKWFQWKMQTELTEKQKSVIKYLEESSVIFNKALETRSVQPDSIYGYSDPKEAIEIVKKGINELKKLSYPKECKKYRNLVAKIMKYIISYHRLRIRYKDGTDKFDRMYKKFQLSEIKRGYNSRRFSEYFECMRNVGLFDNIGEEMKLIDKEK